MLPLVKVQDSIEVVCTTDPSVKPNGHEGVAWIPRQKAKAGKDATIVTVRPMSSSELLRCQGFIGGDESTHIELTIAAAMAGSIRVRGPGLNEETEDGVRAILDRMQPAELAALGGFVLEQSLQTDDPTEATG